MSEKRNFGDIVKDKNTDESYNPKRERTLDFSKTKIGIKSLVDAIVSIGNLTKVNSNLATKENVLQAIDRLDYATMREISDFFFRTNGIYQRLCKYMAQLYCYDWYIVPYINEEKAKEDAVLNDFNKALMLLDNFNVKAFLGKAALKVIRHGAYYGYTIRKDNNVLIQELPANYCRSRFEVNGVPAVEFNMSFFDEMFKDTEQRIRMIKTFPKDFQKGYILYKEGKLPAEVRGEKAGWYLLEPENTIFFNNCGETIPLFISVIPYLIDLDEAQELDRRKVAQQLVKILIQKMPLDKNGDLVFDTDEVAELHNNAVQMLGKAIGVDVLTTFADATVEDLSDSSSVTSVDELAKVERSVYNASGTAQNLFNTNGNLALEKSVINDEASLTNLILQFEMFLNKLIMPFNKNIKKYSFKVNLLKTTIYNYKELSKQYKELTTLGYSKILPAIALGQSQSSIMANAYFETQVLDLVSLLVPPASTNTMSSNATKKQAVETEEKKPGRKEKADDEKSDKTIANKESMN